MGSGTEQPVAPQPSRIGWLSIQREGAWARPLISDHLPSFLGAGGAWVLSEHLDPLSTLGHLNNEELQQDRSTVTPDVLIQRQ